MGDDASINREVLTLADTLAQVVDTALLGHAYVQANPRWKKLAERASDALSELYQQVGADTL